jgi:hypothetical protein
MKKKVAGADRPEDQHLFRRSFGMFAARAWLALRRDHEKSHTVASHQRVGLLDRTRSALNNEGIH